MIGCSVKSCGQRSLADDGKREWDSEIKNRLDIEYPDWKDPKTTHMIPECLDKQGNAGEKAEKAVFDLLKAFGETRKEPMFVVHSYKFKERISDSSDLRNTSKLWVIGEHDFVVIHRQAGFVFLQVKAAVKTSAKYKEAQIQLQKDHDAMKIYLGKVTSTSKEKKDVAKLFSKFPGFVVMPNCSRPSSKASTYADGVFKDDCTSVEAFSLWWDKNIGRNDPIDQDLFWMMVTRFVGLVTISRCLGYRIDKTYEILKVNTTQQLKVLLDSSSEQWIVGPAGSGKTCLLMEKVVMLAEKIILHSLREKILVVCYHKPLSLMMSRVFGNALEDMLQGDDLSSVVDVKTFDKLLKDINGSFNVNDGEKGVTLALEKLKERTGCSKYDHIFVDEGQDLYSTEWPSLFQMIRKSSFDPPDATAEGDHFDPRYFWVFYDSNQHLHLSKEKVRPHSLNIQKSVRLHQVLRNTKNVFEQFVKYFEPIVEPSQKLGVYHQEVGLEITWDSSLQSEEAPSDTNGEQSIAKYVDYLHKSNVEDGDICVLVKDEDKRATLISNLGNIGLHCQNAKEFCTTADRNKIVVDSIRRFKGLESKVVILYNPPFRAESKTRELLYTAISRCFCYLIVISTKQGCEALQSRAGFISGAQGGSERPGQMRISQPVKTGSCNIQNASKSTEFPAKRPFQDDDASDYNHLYKRLKELAGDCDGRLLGPQNSPVEVSIRNKECDKLLPSVWQNLQLSSEYNDVDQSALRTITALVEYHVLQRYSTGNYLANMENMKQEIDTSTEKKELNVNVAGALCLQKP